MYFNFKTEQPTPSKTFTIFEQKTFDKSPSCGV